MERGCCKEEMHGLGMKGSPSDWDLEAFLGHEEAAPHVPINGTNNNNNTIDSNNHNNDNSNRNRLSTTTAATATRSALEFDEQQHHNHQLLFRTTTGGSALCSNPPTFGLLGTTQMGAAGGVHSNHHHQQGMLWPEDLTPKHSTISATMESQLSLCAGSPTSAVKPCTRTTKDVLVPGATSCSEQSDDEESLETEAGQCEQSTDVIDLKRMRRMVSNRESARRSRRRKQAHLADLELQVDQLRGENAHLYKQLTEASQQFAEAATDNRVLKSDVEALRMKVKMAEDLVTRGSLVCSVNHLLQSHTVSPQTINTRNMCRLSEAMMDLEVKADQSQYISMPTMTGQQVNTNNIQNNLSNVEARQQLDHERSLPRDIENPDLQNKIPSDANSCISDVWSWETHVIPASKQL